MFSISKPAVRLYKQELGLEKGDAIQLFCRYGGSETGLGIGVEPGLPTKEDYVQEIDGIRFFVRPHEVWFVEQMSMDCDDAGDNFTIELPSIAS